MSERIRVLLVCYYFPPLGGGGVGRPLSLFKCLPEFGVDCDVLTVKPVAYRAFDSSLLDGLDTSRIHRSGSRDPQRLMRLLGIKQVKSSAADRVRRFSTRFFPDNKVGWVRPAVEGGRTLISNRNYAAIISTSPPISAHLVAGELSRDFKLPWIADFRDFWNSYPPEEAYADPELVRRANELIRDIVEKAARTVAINGPLAESLWKATVIENSYDEKAVRGWSNPVDSEHFLIGLYGGYSAMKPIEPLCHLLAQLRQQAPTMFARVRLLQMGMADTSWIRSELARFDLAEICTFRGHLDRDASILEASRCAALYVGLASERERAFTTARIYYLLASGRPILAAVPVESEIARLVNVSKQGICFLPEDTGVAAGFLESVIDDWRQGRLMVTPESEFARQYSSTRMVERFSQVIRNAI